MMDIPGMLDQLAQTIGVLQQVQRLLPVSATLAEVLACVETDGTEVLICIEAEYGPEMLLEDVIQHLCGRHLAPQVAQRLSMRQRDLEVAA